MAIGNPLEIFQWGQGGQKLSPQEVAEKRRVAQALAARGGAPKNVGEGLSRIGEALLYRSMTGQADEAETAGRATANQAFESIFGTSDPVDVASGGVREGSPTIQELFGLVGNEWASPQQQSVAQALLNQQLQQQDPMYQANLERTNLELEALRNPEPPAPDYDFTFAPDGTLIRTDATSGAFDPMGTFGAQETPDFSSVTLELPDGSQRSFNTADPAQYQMANDLLAQGAIEVPASLVDIRLGDQNDVPSWVSAVGEQEGKDYANMVAAGSAAPRRLAQLDQLEALLAESPTGLAGQATIIAGNFGIDLGEGTSNAQAAQALINQLVPQSRPEGSGPMSDADLALFMQSWPRLINSREGNQMVMDTIRAINMYDYQLGQIVRDGAAAVAQAPDAETRRELEQQMEQQINALTNPLENFNERISPFGGNGGANQSQANPDILNGIGEGTVIENDQGQRLVLRNGQWVEEI